MLREWEIKKDNATREGTYNINLTAYSNNTNPQKYIKTSPNRFIRTDFVQTDSINSTADFTQTDLDKSTIVFTKITAKSTQMDCIQVDFTKHSYISARFD